MPEAVVRELAYTGRLPAAEALQRGFVNAVYDDQGTMLREAEQLAHVIANDAPLAVYGSEQLISHAREHTVADTLDYVSVWVSAFAPREHIRDAVLANAQRQQADFVDLPPGPKQEQG